MSILFVSWAIQLTKFHSVTPQGSGVASIYSTVPKSMFHSDDQNMCGENREYHKLQKEFNRYSTCFEWSIWIISQTKLCVTGYILPSGVTHLHRNGDRSQPTKNSAGDRLPSINHRWQISPTSRVWKCTPGVFDHDGVQGFRIKGCVCHPTSRTPSGSWSWGHAGNVGIMKNVLVCCLGRESQRNHTLASFCGGKTFPQVS